MPRRRYSWDDVMALADDGDGAAAVAACLDFWDREGGVPPASAEDGLRDFTRRLTVWDQISLFVGEVDRRPHNARVWKLLGYAYMWAGLYIPALLRAAEQAFLVNAAHEDDEGRARNAEEKVELCRRALAGDEAARAEIAAGEEAFASPADEIPAEVPMPAAFQVMGVVDRPALRVTAAVVAPDLLDLLGPEE